MYLKLIILSLTITCVLTKSISDKNNVTPTPSSDTNNNDSGDSSTNLNVILNNLEQYKPIEIIKGLSVQVEKTQIPAPSIPTTPLSSAVIKDNDGNQQFAGRQGRKLSSISPTTYLTTHALKLDFGLFNLRLGRSVENPDNLELSVNWADDDESGRGKKDKNSSKMILPMILGFKLASALVIAILTVAALSFKALLAAKIAILVAGILSVKKLFSHAPYKAAPVVSPFASPLQVQPYVMPNYHLDLPDVGAYQHAGFDSGFDASPYINNYGLTGPEASNSDISPSYVPSDQGILEVAAPNNTLAAVAAAKRRDSRNRPYVAKYHPVYNYRKTLKP